MKIFSGFTKRYLSDLHDSSHTRTAAERLPQYYCTCLRRCLLTTTDVHDVKRSTDISACTGAKDQFCSSSRCTFMAICTAPTIDHRARPRALLLPAVRLQRAPTRVRPLARAVDDDMPIFSSSCHHPAWPARAGHGTRGAWQQRNRCKCAPFRKDDLISLKNVSFLYIAG